MKKYLFLLLFGVSCFIYGMYTIGTIENIRPVKPFQWVMTGFFGLFFLGMAVDEFKKDGK
jgi:hypothetical protein